MGVRPLTIEDYLDLEAIKTLRSLYCHYLDGHEWDELGLLFTENAECVFVNHPPNWKGRDEIREHYRALPTMQLPAFAFMHAVTNPRIELIGPESATGKWFLLDLTVGEGSDNALTLTGVYNEQYKKVDGAWHIHRMQIDHLWVHPDRRR